jgi:glycosyltransferase involved in cell wall biosynthesis
MKLFLVINVDWFFLSHRLPVALEAKRRGYQVTVVAIDTGCGEEIRSYGLQFIPLPTDRKGINPLKELRIIILLYRLYKRHRPDIVHHVTLKPVIYGSLAARFFTKTRFINAISGMGYIFTAERDTYLRKLVRRIFKVAFNNPRLRFIFQNEDDKALILSLGVVQPSQCYLIEGSGVDLNQFKFTFENNGKPVQIVYTGRLLRDKGVGELAAAAAILKEKFNGGINVRLVGDVDTQNRASFTREEILVWHQKGVLEWVGFTQNIFAVLSEANIVVLPSYREGLPKSLIEACAVGRAIVTTDVPGCRNVVSDQYNGLLVPPKDVVALAHALEKLILNPQLRAEMGQKGRIIAEQKFSIDHVLNKTFEIYEN